jgi:hypothetical protein
MATPMCRPSGAAKDRLAYLTVKTVGYVMASLRDFEQQKSRKAAYTAVGIFCRTDS